MDRQLRVAERAAASEGGGEALARLALLCERGGVLHWCCQGCGEPVGRLPGFVHGDHGAWHSECHDSLGGSLARRSIGL